MSLQPGSTIEGRYRVERLLGQGGMGAVYQAWDLRLAQWVAIKENALTAAEAQTQFEQEARVLARLRHPNLPRVIDHFITSAGVQYLVMDFVDGPNLAELVRAQGRQAPADVNAWLGQVCDALTYLHSQNPPVIHRDIKPQNIKLTADGRAILVDFGLSKVGAGRDRTATGALGITPGFSPPEQYGAGRTDQRSDIYALAATLYAALTGETPPDSVQRAIQSSQLVPPRKFNPSLSPALEGALLHGLDTQPARRPVSVQEFQTELQQALGTTAGQPVMPVVAAGAAAAGLTRPPSVPRQPSTPPPSARGGIPAWAWFAIGILVVVLLLGSGIFLATRGKPETETPAAVSLASETATAADESPSATPATEMGPTASSVSRASTIDVTGQTVAPPAAPVDVEPASVTIATTALTAQPPTATPPAPAPTATPVVPTATATPVPPTVTATAVPPATSAPRAAVTPCPGYLHKPKPGMGLLLIENHLGEPLHIDRLGTAEKWDLPPKQGDTPGRLLVDLAPGDHEFIDNTSAGYGHIKVSITPGSAFVSPIWYNDRPEELVYPLDIPNGCR
jgi:serine/threonine-protein kinase